jgi:ParB-like chromosome segregation protein Spo0J
MMDIRTLALSDLKPAPYNPRRVLKPADRAYQKLEVSLREFGLVEPLVWNETTGHVVGGHLRLAILRAAGVESVPVSVVRLSSQREKALNVVLNNREAQGRFDPEMLAELLSELEELPELELTGFDPTDLRAMRLEPLDEPAADDAPGPVEVRLCVPRERYDAVSPRIDAVVREFDLECHVKGL